MNFDAMNKSWIKEPLESQAYEDGVDSFMKFASKIKVKWTIPCPCTRCCNLKRCPCDVVHGHILLNGFLPGYSSWTFHGEQVSSSQYDTPYMKKLRSKNQSTQCQSTNIQQTLPHAHNIRDLLQDVMGGLVH